MKLHGVTDVVFLLHYKWESVREYFGDGSKYGIHVYYNVEREPLGRGGALRDGLKHVPASEEQVIGANGDVISHENLSAMIERHKRSRNMATVLLRPLPSPYAVVQIDRRDKIMGFREKPLLPVWINAGVYVMNRGIEALLPEKGDHEDTTFPQLAEQRRLGGFRSNAFWRSVDSFKDLRETEEELRKLPV
jgi:NDP-sugar pyrophosphorylase family protein